MQLNGFTDALVAMSTTIALVMSLVAAFLLVTMAITHYRKG